MVSFRDVCFAYQPPAPPCAPLLDVFPGEIVGVVGQNGAGKTTLTKLLNGLLHPASGEVRVAGLDTRETPTSRLAKHVSTSSRTPTARSARTPSSTRSPLASSSPATAPARPATRRHRRRALWPARRRAAPFSLSRGQRQMVALASVVVMEPEVVLLDEPTSGLDYRECMTVMETVREMAEKGCAVVMVCHDMEVVSDFAERVIVMADGRIAGRATAEGLCGRRAHEAAPTSEPRRSCALPPSARARRLARFRRHSQVSGIVDP